MPNISASFRNDYSESRRWTIVDTGRDPNSPPVIFSDYLEPGQATQAFDLYSSDGVYGQVTYQRSDGRRRSRLQLRTAASSAWSSGRLSPKR